MRKFAFAALASVTVATPALADEGSWTGVYGGVTAGYNVSKSDSTAAVGGTWTTEPVAKQALVTANLSARQQTKGGDIGINLGYLYQTGGFVIGAEAEAVAIGGNAVRATGTLAYSATENYKFTNSIDPKTMIALKARLGAAVGPDTLVFVNAGWAWVSANQSATVTGAVGLLANGNYLKSGATSRSRSGFIVGGGVEQRIAGNFSLRAQYEYTDQGDFTYNTLALPNSLPTMAGYTETINQDLRIHLFRVGVNYHF